MTEEDQLAGADVVVISYGITSRVAVRAVQLGREAGIKVGVLRLITVWPFPEGKIADLASRVKGFVFPEINAGQIVKEVERVTQGKAKVISVPHFGGWVHDPEDIFKAIQEAAK
jgi:2-oxoglutarate ferredoxin oxidoreductase subunit alpha